MSEALLRKWAVSLAFGSVRTIDVIEGTELRITDIGILRIFDGPEVVYAARQWVSMVEIPQ